MTLSTTSSPVSTTAYKCTHCILLHSCLPCLPTIGGRFHCNGDNITLKTKQSEKLFSSGFATDDQQPGIDLRLDDCLIEKEDIHQMLHLFVTSFCEVRVESKHHTVNEQQKE